MKSKAIMLLAALTAVLAPLTAARADEKPTAGKSSKVEAGSRKGRILAVGDPKAEFFVEADKTVSVKFYDKDNKVVAPAAQVVTATIGKSKLAFEKKGDALVSTAKVPDGDALPVVVQVKNDAKAKPQNFRFKLDLSKCGECGNPEYACTCEGH